ncbi:FAD-dependent oxidoreductase [Candidatus Eisenbacteria bacterium]|uniref:FAD-dependent oxidoreductase n=1 Tax=Eiseniibacteriota bacterium TaxID=2212470 RepID=A0ABV6YIB8_UNCEI
MMDAGRHPRIEILRCSEVQALEGGPGEFHATVRRHATGVDEVRCTACGACTQVCRTEGPSRYNSGIGTAKAIDRPFPQSVPAAYAIDFELCKKCKLCVKACPRDAVDLEMEPHDVELDVAAVIVATGFDEFDPSLMRNYGFGVYPDVVTSLQLERMLNASGPTMGHVRRLSNGESPHSFIFVQCVGARGEAGQAFCSRFCCMNAVKDAILTKQHDPNLESVTILYTDLRAFGKGFDALYERARAMDWIKFVRGRPSKINENPETHDLEVLVEDTESGKPLRLKTEMVVLSCAGKPAAGTEALANKLGIETGPQGFVARKGSDTPLETKRAGVFVCGSAAGPHVIPECVAQGSAAAALAAAELHRAGIAPAASRGAKEHKSDHRVPANEAGGPDDATAPPEGGTEQSRVGVFLCHCGVNIAGVLDMKQLLSYASTLPGVVFASDELFACSSTSQEVIQKTILKHDLNRLVIAACTPRTHEAVFRQNCEAAGLNPYLVEMVNVRDQCSWIHADKPEEATDKARDLLRMGVARARGLEPLERVEVGVTQHALVIGGGLTGMRAASDLLAQGLRVTLVERQQQLGGLTRALHTLYPDGTAASVAVERIENRIGESGIDLRMGTVVQSVSGFVGNFKVQLVPSEQTPDDQHVEGEELEVGAIVVAIGAEAYEPQQGEFGYGTYENVITTSQLEHRLADAGGQLKGIDSVAFIQCVGSRCPERVQSGGPGNPGCSRICCPATVKQTLELQREGVNSIVFYRDMRTVGLGGEEMYRDSRSSGAVYVRFGEDKPPELIGSEGKATEVRVWDTLLHTEVSVPVDLVVLATGLVPRVADAQHIQEMLKTPRGADGFFLERHPELAPVETCVDGVFVCGTAQGPKDLPDALAQASAVAAKAGALLGRQQLYLEPTVCEIDAALCRGCGLCVSLCEFHAPSLQETGEGQMALEVAQINAALCKGCGTCAVWCPTGAIRARHFTDSQITEMIDSLFQPSRR